LALERKVEILALACQLPAWEQGKAMARVLPTWVPVLL
jgi:hypothetical protein